MLRESESDKDLEEFEKGDMPDEEDKDREKESEKK